jgi:hypothetical protein
MSFMKYYQVLRTITYCYKRRKTYTPKKGKAADQRYLCQHYLLVLTTYPGV